MKYLGILMLLVGAILLIATGLVSSLSNNTMLATGLVLVVLGYLLHIFVSRKVIV